MLLEVCEGAVPTNVHNVFKKGFKMTKEMLYLHAPVTVGLLKLGHFTSVLERPMLSSQSV